MKLQLLPWLLVGFLFANMPETWTVNPQDFQYNYTVTAQLTINSNIVSDTSKVLAAFMNGECRGISEFSDSQSGWMTFLVVHSNSLGPIMFQYYDKEEDVVYSIEEYIIFTPSGYAGNPDTPFNLNGSELNQPPIADAGEDQVIGEGYTVYLDGSGSSDSNGNILGYSWSNNAGIELPNPNIASPFFTAPLVDEDEQHLFFLQVTDGTFFSEPDTIILTIEYRLSTDHSLMADEYSLLQNYPNPFNPLTKIRYSLPIKGHVRITVYDMVGKKVKTLMNQVQDAGYKSIIWDGTNGIGSKVSSGMYIYEIEAGDYHNIKQMVLLK
ncbi:MAG: PKD domain-containing protein [Candidatus Neomarinimicrobiota bacterium]|nr:MAG: T9SS type A sorting domain-containing protein [bacterium]